MRHTRERKPCTLGIDWGAARTKAAEIGSRDPDQPYPLQDHRGQIATPSFVAETGGSCRFGWEALDSTNCGFYRPWGVLGEAVGGSSNIRQESARAFVQWLVAHWRQKVRPMNIVSAALVTPYGWLPEERRRAVHLLRQAGIPQVELVHDAEAIALAYGVHQELTAGQTLNVLVVHAGYYETRLSMLKVHRYANEVHFELQRHLVCPAGWHKLEQWLLTAVDRRYRDTQRRLERAQLEAADGALRRLAADSEAEVRVPSPSWENWGESEAVLSPADMADAWRDVLPTLDKALSQVTTGEGIDIVLPCGALMMFNEVRTRLFGVGEVPEVIEEPDWLLHAPALGAATFAALRTPNFRRPILTLTNSHRTDRRDESTHSSIPLPISQDGLGYGFVVQDRADGSSFFDLVLPPGAPPKTKGQRRYRVRQGGQLKLTAGLGRSLFSEDGLRSEHRLIEDQYIRVQADTEVRLSLSAREDGSVELQSESSVMGG